MAISPDEVGTDFLLLQEKERVNKAENIIDYLLTRHDPEDNFIDLTSQIPCEDKELMNSLNKNEIKTLIRRYKHAGFDHVSIFLANSVRNEQYLCVKFKKRG